MKQQNSHSDTDDEFSFTIIASKKPQEVTLKIADVPTAVIIDTGLSLNLLNQKKVKSDHQHTTPAPTTSAEVRSILHINDYSTIHYPLRQL